MYTKESIQAYGITRKSEMPTPHDLGNLGVELCEDISTLPYVRSTSGRSVLVILFGGDDDDVNNFKLMTSYSF